MEQKRASVSTEAEDSAQQFESKLENGPQRFLAHVMEHALAKGRRTPEDFIRHFPPTAIMDALGDEPQLRADILVMATGVRIKIALKKPASSCGADLQIALDEKEVAPGTIVQLFRPDDRVRFLDARALWAFLVEGDFWNADAKKDPSHHGVASAHLGYMIERALEDRLLSPRDVVRGITVEKMMSVLPRVEIPKVVHAALDLGGSNKPFLEKNLLDAVTLATLTKHVPLAWLYSEVVVPFIAEKHDLVGKAVSAPETAEAPSTREDAVSAKAGAPSTREDAVSAKAALSTSDDADAAQDDEGLDLDVDEVLGELGDRPSVSPQPNKAFKVPIPKSGGTVPPPRG